MRKESEMTKKKWDSFSDKKKKRITLLIECSGPLFFIFGWALGLATATHLIK